MMSLFGPLQYEFEAKLKHAVTISSAPAATLTKSSGMCLLQVSPIQIFIVRFWALIKSLRCQSTTVVSLFEGKEMACNTMPMASASISSLRCQKTPAITSSYHPRKKTEAVPCPQCGASYHLFSKNHRGTLNSKPHQMCIECYRSSRGKNREAGKTKDNQRSVGCSPKCHQLSRVLSDGFIEHHRACNPELAVYWPLRHSLFVENGVVMYNDRAVIPTNLRDSCLSILHSAHQGVSGMESRACSLILLSGMNGTIT